MGLVETEQDFVHKPIAGLSRRGLRQLARHRTTWWNSYYTQCSVQL